MMIGCVLNSLLLFQLFLLLMDFNPFLITWHSHYRAFLHCYKISRSSSSSQNYTHQPLSSFVSPLSYCSFNLRFRSYPLSHHLRLSEIPPSFFFFFFRVDASSNKARVENVRRITNFFRGSRAVSVKRVCEFHLVSPYNATFMLQSTHDIDSVIRTVVQFRRK